MDSHVQGLRASLKAISTHSKCLPLGFPQLQRLAFDRAAVSESNSLLLQLVAQQPGLLAHLRELDLSSCQVGVRCWLAGGCDCAGDSSSEPLLQLAAGTLAAYLYMF